MQTRFTPEQLQDPRLAEAETILRKCVHCGFCTATCPTYVLLGDEADSPRGRIYAIKDMLESGRPATARAATHLDRCLTCLSCMTTCPSGVDYHHLVDIGRAHMEATHARPAEERLLRRLLKTVLPHPARFRAALAGARLARPLAGALPGPLAQLMRLAPAALPPDKPLAPGLYPAQGTRRARVALLAGCVQQVLGTDVNAATIRLLNRLGVEVVVAAKAGCCGALAHHLGDEAAGKEAARRNVAAWSRIEGLDAIIINASGCGTMVKDYGHLLGTPEAAAIAHLARDVTEVLVELGFSAPSPPPESVGMVVAYHPACSLNHGQKVRTQPKALLAAAGFEVREPQDAHLCCGSAGTYSITQPELSTALRDRKASTLAATGARVVASGNIGCMEHLRAGMTLPIVHTVQLLDWASGGPRPRGL